MKTNVDYSKLNVARISAAGFEQADEVKVIPRGTFAGTIYELGLVGEFGILGANTGDQGGGQN